MFYVVSRASPQASWAHSRGARCQERHGNGVGHPVAAPRPVTVPGWLAGWVCACRWKVDEERLASCCPSYFSHGGCPSIAGDRAFPGPDVSKGTPHPLILVSPVCITGHFPNQPSGRWGSGPQASPCGSWAVTLSSSPGPTRSPCTPLRIQTSWKVDFSVASGAVSRSKENYSHQREG